MVVSKQAKFRKSSVLLVGLSALILLALGTSLNIWFGRAVRQIAKDQFNEEQLVVARGIKYWIEREIGFLEKELLLNAKNIEGTVTGPEELYLVLQPCFDRVVELGVGKIELYDRARPVKYICYPHREQMDSATGESPAIERADVMSATDSGPTIFVSQPMGDGPEMYLILSVVLNHPLFDRVSFHLSLSWFLTPFLKYIRSGKTGYAWIIDGRGRFLYHPQSTFIGRSAFEARQDRDPDISHHLIDTIQSDNMLTGMEGTGSYVAAWHRGITGKVEKLIAYSPVVISSAWARTWSVAVVAPVFEIEEAVDKIHRWQAMLQGLVMLVIVVAGGTVLVFEVRFSRRLEQTVQARTMALKRSEENYRSLVESAEDFIFTLDNEGKLLSVNSFTAASFGSSPEELVGIGVDYLFTQEVAERQFKIVRSVYEKGKSVRDEFELRMGTTDIWISANFMPLKDESGRMSAVLCIARDITENKKLERYLINTEKLASLGTLAAGVAHEINNPLGVMLGFCDLLVRKKEPGSQEYEDLKIIERQGLQCKQIVENLLSFARVGRDTTTHVDLNTCLQEIIKVVRHSLEMKAIDLQTDLRDNLPKVLGDDRQLQQVFLNLITNAAAVMPGGGVLTIATALVAGGKKVVVKIKDQGTGIAPEVIDHIFEPFFTTKPEGEGTGLGLFVSYGIINKFGGSIACESQLYETPDTSRGTIFTVELPAAREEERWSAES
jgi:two-component system NtrC family sensor kinase